MVKRSQRSSEAEPRREVGAQPDTTTRVTNAEPARTDTRKPYQRPLVQKRRSLAEATLFSGSGVPGVLIS